MGNSNANEQVGMSLGIAAMSLIRRSIGRPPLTDLVIDQTGAGHVKHRPDSLLQAPVSRLQPPDRLLRAPLSRMVATQGIGSLPREALSSEIASLRHPFHGRPRRGSPGRGGGGP